MTDVCDGGLESTVEYCALVQVGRWIGGGKRSVAVRAKVCLPHLAIGLFHG